MFFVVYTVLYLTKLFFSGWSVTRVPTLFHVIILFFGEGGGAGAKNSICRDKGPSPQIILYWCFWLGENFATATTDAHQLSGQRISLTLYILVTERDTRNCQLFCLSPQKKTTFPFTRPEGTLFLNFEILCYKKKIKEKCSYIRTYRKVQKRFY